MLLVMLMFNFEFPQLFIDFLKPFQIVNFNFDFLSKIPYFYLIRDFFSVDGMNNPDISRMEMNRNTFMYVFIYIFIIMLFIMLIHWIFYWIYRKYIQAIGNSRIKKRIFDLLKEWFYLGFYIHYLLETFMAMAISSIFTLINFNRSNAKIIISSSWWGLYLISMAIFIIFVIYRVWKIRDEYEPKGKFQALYHEIDYPKRGARHYVIFFILKRICLVGIVMGLTNWYLQISLAVTNQIIFTIYLWLVRPFEKGMNNLNTLIVEFGSLICLCFVFFSSSTW